MSSTRPDAVSYTHLDVYKRQIKCSALGWAVSGTWNWNEGYFCREMDWSGTPIPHNCQLVEARGDRKLRFTTDRGAGDSASFDLR